MKAVVVGAGGQARVVLSLLQLLGKYEVIGLVDRAGPSAGETILGARVIGRWEDLPRLRTVEVGAAFIALGSSTEREQLSMRCVDLGFELPSLVHPAAFVDPSATIGSGVTVCAMAFVGPNVELGTGVLLNTGALVDHESQIGAFATISPAVAIAGRCTIGARAFLGMGSMVSDGCSVGQAARVGAGSVVLDNVPDEVLVVGTPARIKFPTTKT